MSTLRIHNPVNLYMRMGRVHKMFAVQQREGVKMCFLRTKYIWMALMDGNGFKLVLL